MEKFDKNYIIGFILLFVMYVTYMYFYQPAEVPQVTETSISKDSVGVSKNQVQPLAAPVSAFADSSVASFAEKTIEVENENIKASFTTNGGILSKVVLKDYKTYAEFEAKSKNAMVIFDNTKSRIDLDIATTLGVINLNSLPYTTASQNAVIKEGANSEITLESTLKGGEKIQKIFKIDGKGYVINENIKLVGFEGKLLKQPAQFSWTNNIQALENDIKENRKAAQINYYDKEENFEDLGLGSEGDNDEKADLPVKWFSFKQKYFTSGVVSENGFFENSTFALKTPIESNDIVKTGIVKGQMPIDELTSGKANLKYYFGPNELSELKPVTEGFQQNLYLGYDVVKPINRYVFVPLFRWVESFVSNYGLLIILVVLIIKITLTPLIYKSYVSSAKMRLLAPEIADIKEKVGDDAVKVQQETMKLYQQVGVSPLSGCVPLVLQMPILMSVFFLFPNMIMFRQKSFLWSNDLSTFDAPISWATNIPIIGNHISLFVVLMTLSSLAFTYYNNQVTPDQPGPIDMKKISYIFPLVFFFVLNSFPAALSFYYLVSNLVTIAQQLIVRKFIDEDKIMGILEKNRKNYATKPQKKSKFGDFIQKQLQASEEMKKQSEELKKKGKKK
ncbi:membrane protein insertase YidC [Lacihabitans lacunae]|uniref:Membrane protein insertase YidC n=1 Tax=Lacihabitans lacunae TaxID=1028214 RepID=A0ABV7YTF2_9BACT